MTNRNIALWYQTLGLGPGRHDWRAVQKRYRRLVRQLHPDRLPADSPQRAAAEERVKQINVAYRALAAQHRLHGELPPFLQTSGQVTRRPVAPPRRPRSAPVSAPQPDIARPTAHDAAEKVPDTASARPNRVWVVPIAVLAALGYFAVTQLGEISDRWLADTAASGGASAVPGAGERPRAAPFTIGATLGQVHAAQGIPTSVDDDVWHYGLSTVKFVNGRVQSWQEHPDYPLNVQLIRPDEYGIESSSPRNP